MRTIAALLLFIGVLVAPARTQTPRDDHGNAIAALAGVQSAVAEIVRIEDSNQVGRSGYARAAHRALSALVGPDGALRHLDRMLDQTATPRWAAAVEGAKTNLLAAAEDLQTAIGEREQDDYQLDVTRALANLGLVVGRPSQEGVLGGLSGALANTDLGVPAGAVRVSGCSTPTRVPAYGVVAGRLMYVALPRTIAATRVPPNLDVRAVVVRGDDVILYTQQVSQAASACRSMALRQRTREVVAAADPMPAFYTSAQAHAGAVVYARYCLQCHGTDLQGTAGPAVAGTEFLKTAKLDGWTLRDVRTTVFENMPFSNPGSLTAKQYADVMAFLLASSCFPAGTKPFPESDQSWLAGIKLGPLTGAKPTHTGIGTCAVK
jgi:polar amino acid transport system substrate-binding protein